MPARTHIYLLTLLLTLTAAVIPVRFWDAPGLAHAQIQKRESILVLHSYSQDFVWTRSQQEGIDAVFKPLAAAYDVRIEYLDAVHHPELLKGPLLFELLRSKLSNQRFRMVLTSDNAAFDFARTHRAELFPGAPIIFLGVNGYTDSMLQGEQGITGVAEDPDLGGTLRVLLQLMPQTKRIVFPGMTEDITYSAIRSTIAKELQALPPGVTAEFPQYPDVDAALVALRTLPPDAVIVIMSNMRTRDGDGISSQRVVELVSAASPVPVFTNWDFTVGHGALGGSVISGVEQGRQAAEIAVRVLRGEPAESIPVRRGAGKTLLFDYRQLTRFGIPLSRLPAESVTLFKPERIVRISRETAWGVGISFMVLSAATVFLVFTVRRRRRAEEQVRAINLELESVNSALGIEIEEHRQAEIQLSRLNRELRAISNCNQVLMKATDESTLLHDICRIVCDDAGYRMAWVGYAEVDEAKTIRLMARGGVDDGYLDEAKLTWADTERGSGPTGNAIRTGRSDCIQDFATDPKAVPWREAALLRGYRSSIALPLKNESGGVFGTLCIYSTITNAFTPDEIRLLEELAGDLAYGLGALRARTERERAERALRVSDVRFAELFNKTAIPLCFVNKHDDTLELNARFVEIFGYSREEITSLGAWWQAACPDPAHHARMLDMCAAALQRATANNAGIEPLECRITCKNGTELTTVVYSSSIGQDLLLTFFDITERKQTEEALSFIAQLGWGGSTENYLTALARYLGETLAMDYVIIDRLVADAPGVAETAALYAKGAFLPAMRYKLMGTPCHNVVGKKLCCYPRNVQSLFPDDTILVDMGADSYAGIPLWDSAGHPVGLIAVMDGKPLLDEKRVTHILQLVATSAAAALERERNDALLRKSEERYRLVFENSPVSIWEEDFSGVKALFDGLRQQGVSDIEAYFSDHPEVIEQCAQQARIVNINDAALRLHGAASKEELLAGLVNTFTPDSFITFRQELVCLWHGGTAMIRDAEVKTLAGEPRQVSVYFALCPGYEDTFAKVVVSLVDITERKRMETAIHLQTVELEEEVAERQVAQESLQEKAQLLEEEIEKRQEAQEELERLNTELDLRVQERAAAFVEKNAELERMNRLFVGRELKMVELKERIKELENTIISLQS